MRYRDAKKLHNEDQIRVKKTGRVLSVVETDVTSKNVTVLCDDGNEYHHTEIK